MDSGIFGWRVGEYRSFCMVVSILVLIESLKVYQMHPFSVYFSVIIMMYCTKKG